MLLSDVCAASIEIDGYLSGTELAAHRNTAGTEDAVRVYAEAETQAQADALAAQVGRLVYQHAGGVGDMP